MGWVKRGWLKQSRLKCSRESVLVCKCAFVWVFPPFAHVRCFGFSLTRDGLERVGGCWMDALLEGVALSCCFCCSSGGCVCFLVLQELLV